MKKMRFVTKGLVLLMMGVMLAGCSDKATVKDEDKKTESEESKKASKEDSKEASQEGSKEDASSEAGSSEVSSSEEISGGDLKPINEGGNGGSAQGSDLVQEYRDSLKNFSMEGKMISYDMNMAEEGMDIDLAMKFGVKDGGSYMYLAVPTQDGGASSLEFIYLADQAAYLRIVIPGEDPVAYMTKNLDPEEASDMNIVGDLSGLTTGENGDIPEMEYVGEETIGGVKYDVLKPVDDDTGICAYFNPKTKELEKMTVEAEGQKILMSILPMDFELKPIPGAEEQDSESFAMTMMMGMLGVIYSAGGFDLD